MDNWVLKIQAKRACAKQTQASTITSLLAKNEIIEALIVVVEVSFQPYWRAIHHSINVQGNLKHLQNTEKKETPKYTQRERSLLLMVKILEYLNPQ